MNISGGQGSWPVLVATDQKTVHKSDVDNLARSVKTVLQSSSKLVKELKSQEFSANQKITSLSDSKTIRQTLSDKLEEVKAWKGQLGRSSYEHASFKGEKLDSLAKKIETDINSLKKAEESGVRNNQFLDKLLVVKWQGEDGGFKLDQNN